jgi:lipopolysaccharide/colanic/teichoic acid biosynthesis glycosyltransferase
MAEFSGAKGRLAGTEFMSAVAPTRSGAFALALKRALDIVVGGLLAIAALPIILVLAVLCAIALRAWPLFLQPRIGKDGRTFVFPKLRTLPASTLPSLDKYSLNGTRIPRFCRFLRGTHLDELPQLVLVPVGRMSLIGPRPEMPDVLVRYPADFVHERTRLRPGCTGLWQVSRSVTKLIYEAPEFDRLYLRRGGLLLDCWILYRTLRLPLSRDGHIELDDVPRWALGRGYVTPNGSGGAFTSPLPEDTVRGVSEPTPR